MNRNTKRVSTPFGNIAYTERGSGPAALFVHGVFLNGYYWRHVIDRVAACGATPLKLRPPDVTTNTARGSILDADPGSMFNADWPVR